MRERMCQHLDVLSVQIGSRPIGSPANLAAQNYIRGVMAELGYVVEVQEYPCPAWQDHGATLTVTGDPVPVVTNMFSPPGRVAGQAVSLPTFESLVDADLENRIAVLYGELTRSPLAPASWFLAGERDLAIPRLLVERGAVAVVTVPPAARETERVIEDDAFPLPSVTVRSVDAGPLLRAPQVELLVDTETHEGSTANVVGRRPGDTGSGRVVVCAHYDSKIDTPGATDNGTGVAVLLGVAERQATGTAPVELVAFTGEEYLPIGDDEYLRRRDGDLSNVVAALNIDGAGHALDVTTVMETEGRGPLRDALAREVGTHREVVWVDPYPESNHSTFSMRGVPAACFSSPQARELSHLRSDTVDRVDVDRLLEISEIIDHVVNDLTRPATRLVE